MRKLTKNQFILKSREIHGFKYDYSKSDYKNSRTKVCIICPKHGEFWQTPNGHIEGRGCPICANEKKSYLMKKGKKDFLKEANKKYQKKYDYSKVNYIDYYTKVCIICPEHGEFWQSPSLHLRTNGCQLCSNKNRSIKKSYDTTSFIEKAKEVHGDKYNYSKVDYKGCYEKICIICPEHGEFWQKAYLHLNGQGCKLCGNLRKNLNRVKTLDMFINEANNVHKNKYNYSKVDYKNTKTKVCIICPEHGEFWQTPNNHLNGKGCPRCNESKLEKELSLFFDENNIEYEKWKKFSWLGKQSIDFFLPKFNIGIECQGIQHFEYSKNEKSFFTKKLINKIKERDKRKKELCDNNGIKLLYYSNFEINFPYDVITDKNKLLNIIKNYV